MAKFDERLRVIPTELMTAEPIRSFTVDLTVRRLAELHVYGSIQ
jgi:hypothetical protein